MSSDAAAGERMKGKDFEKIVLERLRDEAREAKCHFTRYGVQASIMAGDNGGTGGPSGFARGRGQVVTTPSYPDIEGAVRALGGRHVVFDCKVESGSSFSLGNYRRSPGQPRAGSREKQLTHMLNRSAVGGICFFLIRWSRRQLATKDYPLAHFAFPVHRDLQFWDDFEAGDRNSITRDDCEELGVSVEWNVRDRERTPRPDVLAAIMQLAQLDIFSLSRLDML